MSNQGEESGVSRSEQIATRFLKRKGIRRPEGPVIGQGVGADVIAEGYDLFFEKQQLNGFIVRRQRDLAVPEGAPLRQSLEDKQKLIREGKVGILTESKVTDQTYPAIVGKAQDHVARIDERLGQIFSTPDAYHAFLADLSSQIRIRTQAVEVKKLRKFIDTTRVDIIKIGREFETKGTGINPAIVEIVEEGRLLSDTAQERIDSLMEDETVADRVRLDELKEYQEQLKKDRFAETPSRLAAMTELEKFWGQNKKVLITGATGTGKTELVRHASKVFFEKKPFEITGHTNMTAYELLGRTGLSQGSDLYRPSKIVQAMTADGVGGPLLYDEMNASPNEANIAIKTLLNDGPGDEVSIQMDSNENKTVGPDYSFTATVNPKSDKHKTRYEMDPAIVRIFEPMILPYMPPHEVWDTAIASMMDARGGIPLSVQDASKVLKNLCDAASWTQQAYLGQKISLDQSGGFLEAKGGASTGKQATLKDAVLDPGRVIKMLQGWSSARLEGQQFIEFLNEQLSRFANNEEYPEDDREYLRKIFGLKGFSVNTGLDEPRRIRMPHTEKSSLRPDQVARLDPYGKRTTSVARDALELLEDDFSPVFTGELAQSATVEQAKEALGKDFLGVEAVRKFEQILKEGGLDVQFNLDSIVPFPYTQKDIEFAKANNEVLTLRPDGITYKGKQMPLTVTTLKDLIGRLPEDSKLRDSFPDLRPPTIKKHWYGEEIVKPTEEWYTDKKISSDNIHSSWKLTGRDPLSQSVEQYNEWLKKRGCTQGNIPKFNELMWDMVLIFAVNGESLIKGPAYATTDFGKTVYNQEQVVVVKGIDSTGFHVAYPDHYGGYNSDFQKSGKSIYFSR